MHGIILSIKSFLGYDMVFISTAAIMLSQENEVLRRTHHHLHETDIIPSIHCKHNIVTA